MLSFLSVGDGSGLLSVLQEAPRAVISTFLSFHTPVFSETEGVMMGRAGEHKLGAI